MSTHFKNITYLKEGNERQQKLYRLLKSHNILEQLEEFDPIVVGTIPIEIDIESSDVDIVLYAENSDALIAILKDRFSEWEAFQITRTEGKNEVVVCNFILENTPFELYATTIPTDQQPGYLHMVKEYEILCREGREFKQKISDLKRQGIKTEPAFCKLLGLTGEDPYQELLELDIDAYYK